MFLRESEDFFLVLLGYQYSLHNLIVNTSLTDIINFVRKLKINIRPIPICIDHIALWNLYLKS